MMLGAVKIDIAPNFSLHAGDCVFIDVPDTGGGSTDKFVSGRFDERRRRRCKVGCFCCSRCSKMV